MRIVFLGNPVFALPTLSSLSNSRHEVVAVVSSADTAKGRGMKQTAGPVASFARQSEIPLLQPESLKSESLAASLQELNADLFVVVAFKILPRTLLGIPKQGCINLHGSLLPEYRGAAPIQKALLNGDSVTGLTTFILAPTVDTGDLLLTEKIVIYPDDDYGSLSYRMSHLGASLIMKTLDGIEHDTLIPTPQDDSIASKAPKIKPDMCHIRWDKSAVRIRNLVRALSPAPSAYTFIKGRRIKIFKTMFSARSPASPGEIINAGKNTLVVSCGSGSLELSDVQLEGKRRMTVAEFLQGLKLSSGERFGA